MRCLCELRSPGLSAETIAVETSHALPVRA